MTAKVTKEEIRVSQTFTLPHLVCDPAGALSRAKAKRRALLGGLECETEGVCFQVQ